MKATPDQAERLHRFAHDLRNRLIGMQQAMAMLAESAAADRAELMAFAEQQYFKAMRASEELLDDLQVDRAPRIAGPQRVGLHAVVSDAIAALAHRFERKQQQVRVEGAAQAWTMGDPRLLGRLAEALLSNASKFSPAGAPINVRLEVREGNAVLSVTDQGIGLDDEDLAQVLVRYAWLKGRPTAGEAQGRSTLGQAKQWAEAHGGRLSATSPGTGCGTTFTVELPAA
jgi:signal transduction histidine kinase